MRFEDLRLTEPLLRAVRTARYVDPTPIQAQAIPLVLAGRDVLGCAQTGTGKDGCVCIAHPAAIGFGRAFSASDSDRGPCPRPGAVPDARTRAADLRELSHVRPVHRRAAGRVFGGVNQNPQVRTLRAGVDILIATPGRLLDLMGQGLASVSGAEILVLDEADRMLDMGFLPDLRRILTHVPRRRQTLLFSATMPPPIRKLAGDILHEPEQVQVTRVSSPAPSVAHWVYHVEKQEENSAVDEHAGADAHTNTGVHAYEAWGGQGREAARKSRRARRGAAR